MAAQPTLIPASVSPACKTFEGIFREPVAADGDDLRITCTISGTVNTILLQIHILYHYIFAVCLLEQIWYELMITALSYQHPEGDFILCPCFNLVPVFVRWDEEGSVNVDTWYTLLVKWSTAWFLRLCVTKSELRCFLTSTWGSCCVSVKQTLLWTKRSFFFKQGFMMAQCLGQDPSLTNSSAAHRRFIAAKTNMCCRGPDLWNVKTPGCRCILKSGL